VLIKLARKLKKKTSILTDAEVRFMVRRMQNILGPEFLKTVSHHNVRLEDGVRWGSLQARCEDEREKRGLTLKEASSHLKIPQYRLRAIEAGTLREFKAEFAGRYFQYLGIESWVKRWARANAELARRAGIRRGPRRSRATH
jgi:hypothetical protein